MSQLTLTAADGHRFDAYTAGSEGARMGLVVVQEIFGVNSHMRFVCDTLARAGFATIAPALFDRVERGVELGYTAETIQKGLELRAGITEAQVMMDVEAAAEALGLPAIGIIGYCWGGTIAWWGATRSTRFRAACGWYGGGIAATRAETPHCPVQLHFGAEDHGIPAEDVAAIREAQPGVEIFVYDGADHGFGCEARASFNQAAFDLAQSRSLAFFAKHLGA
ncbi:dienelactone hydrolase family protein [Acidisoma sp. C75]